VVQCGVVWCSVVQCAVRYSVVQCDVVRCSVMFGVCYSMLPCVAACCSVLPRVAARCRVLQSVADHPLHAGPVLYSRTGPLTFKFESTRIYTFMFTFT